MLLTEPISAQVPLLAGLPRHELVYRAETLRQVSIPAGAVLMREGEPGDRCYVVLDGQVEIVKALGTADERLLSRYGAGELFGEMSLLNPDHRRSASVRTQLPALLLEITRNDFDALLARQPTFAYEMGRMLSRRLRDTVDATIRDLQAKNRELIEAYQALQAAQLETVEKEAFDRELQVTRELQARTLPRTLPQLAGFDFGARLEPARIMSGDFFDFIPLGPDTLGIVVADVCGKGVPAAFVMGLARSLIRAEAGRASQPAQALQRVNQHLLDMVGSSMFVTVLYGVLDQVRRTFVYARAGHDLPIIFDGAGAVTEPQRGPGLPLGLLPDPELDQQEITIPAGGGLLLYTDGMTEAMDPRGEFFGQPLLRQVVRLNRDIPAQELCDRLLETVRAFHGQAPQDDDVTLVVIRAD
jgi:serine phosphatase RsbU (regulator of sigma subunit)